MSDERESMWAALTSEVSAGSLYLEPGTAAKCADHCTTLLAKLAKLKDRAYGLQYVEGFGTLPSGVAVARKFSLAAVGGDYSMVDALADHIAEVEAMRNMFLQIEAHYAAAEQHNEQKFAAIAPDLE
ncbi:hypothetical protein [Rhodococcus triatomae]|nr:hypothetical protein G419_05652 [Rhodococcus triatomae BKS 15-14]